MFSLVAAHDPAMIKQSVSVSPLKYFNFFYLEVKFMKENQALLSETGVCNPYISL